MRVGQLSAIDFASKVLSSLLGFAATIYFSRVLGPSVLGTYYLIFSVVGWLSLVGRVGVQSALVKRISEDEEPDAYLAAGGLILIGITAVLAVVLVALRGPVNDYLGESGFEFVLALVVVALVWTYVDSTLQGQRLVHVSSMLKPVRRALRTAIQIGLVIAGFGIGGLIAGYALGGVLAIVIGLLFVSLEFERPRREHFESLFDYAKYAWLGQLKGRTFDQADIFVLGFFVTSALVGVYGVAWSLAGFLSIFSSSIVAALFPHVSNLSSKAGIRESKGIVTDAFAYAGLITIPGLFGGVLLGGNVLAIYGSEFVRGTAVLGLLIAASLLHDYEGVIVGVLGALDRPDLAFRVNATLVVSNVVLNVALISVFGWIGAAVATLLSVALSLALGYYILNELLDISLPVAQIGRQVVAAALMAFTILGAERALEAYGVNTMRAVPTVSLVFFGAGVYALVLLAISETFRRTVFGNLLPFLRRAGLSVDRREG